MTAGDKQEEFDWLIQPAVATMSRALGLDIMSAQPLSPTGQAHRRPFRGGTGPVGGGVSSEGRSATPASVHILSARPASTAPFRPATDPQGAVCHPQYRNEGDGWCMFCRPAPLSADTSTPTPCGTCDRCPECVACHCPSWRKK